MSLHENATDEEQSILDILIDQDIQSESAGGHCSQKRKAAGDIYDSNSEQRARVCTCVHVLYMAICLGICFNNKKTLDTEQVGSVCNTSDLYLLLISAGTRIILLLFMAFVTFSRQIPE